MNPLQRFQKTHITPTEDEAEYLQKPVSKRYTVEIRPPQHGDLPSSLTGFIQGILELQSAWLGLRNTSPVTAFEIRRINPGKIRFQFATPLKRLERKIRTQLSNEIPDIRFETGINGVPANSEVSLGGGLLTTGRRDWFPLQTDHDSPPTNSVVAALHRHAMQDTRFIIQILFQPVNGNPVRNWWWRKQAYHHRNYLTKEKERFWGSITPTRREKQQAHSIDQKTANSRYHVTIRFLLIGAQEYTPSRIKELAGSFNQFENPGTGQYLDAITITPFRRKPLLSYASAIAERQFQQWTRKFRATPQELAALVSIPDRLQNNIQYADP